MVKSMSSGLFVPERLAVKAPVIRLEPRTVPVVREAPKVAQQAVRAPRKGPSWMTKAAKLISRNSRKITKHTLTGVVGLATLGIAAMSGVVSFDHIRFVATFASQSPMVAAMTPLTADGMILIGGYRLRNAAGNRTRMIIAIASMAIGLIASLGGNVLYAVIINMSPEAQAAIKPALVVIFSAWPVVPLVTAIEMMTHTRVQTIRRQVHKATQARKTVKK